MKYKRSVIIGCVFRIYRACSSWVSVHKGLEEAKQTFLNNQYPLTFIEDTFNNTLTKILIGEQNDDHDPEELELDPNACILDISDKEKFLFFVNYRGKPSEKF